MMSLLRSAFCSAAFFIASTPFLAAFCRVGRRVATALAARDCSCQVQQARWVLEDERQLSGRGSRTHLLSSFCCVSYYLPLVACVQVANIAIEEVGVRSTPVACCRVSLVSICTDNDVFTQSDETTADAIMLLCLPSFERFSPAITSAARLGAYTRAHSMN